jgi:hypothetical protein
MAIDIKVAATVRKSRKDVAAIMFDPRFAPAWARVLDAKLLSDPPIRVGTRIARVRRRLGRLCHDIHEVTALIPERLLEVRAAKPYPMAIQYELEGIPEGVIATIRASGQPAGLTRLLEPLLRMRLRRQIMGDLYALKRLMETNAFRELGAAQVKTR